MVALYEDTSSRILVVRKLFLFFVALSFMSGF
jgi:hypothetical protein